MMGGGMMGGGMTVGMMDGGIWPERPSVEGRVSPWAGALCTLPVIA